MGFQTQVSNANINVSPMGFISGETDAEFPSCFEFAPHFADGSLLTVAWSTGRVQHLPMFFTPSPPPAAAQHPVTSFNVNTSVANDVITRVGGSALHLSTSHLLNNSIGA